MAEGFAKTYVRRVQLACMPCHQAKLKCNRELACDQCLKRSRETQCVYTEGGRRCNAARQHASATRARLDHLEQLFAHLKDPSDSDFQLSDSCGHSHRDDAVTKSSPCLKVASPSRPAGNTYYISPSHWESIMDDISAVKASLDTQDSPESVYSQESFESESSAILTDLHFNMPASLSKDELLHLLPSKFDTDRFVSSWYNGIDPLRLIVHAPSFQIDYQQFWQDQMSVDTQWLAMLFAIATAGAEISGQARNDAASLAIADQLRTATAHAINLANCTAIKKWLIETLLIHARAYQLRRQDTDVYACLLIGCCTRLAIMAGFHLDPSHSTSLSPFVCEMRRRIWVSVREHEICTSYQRGAFSAIMGTKNDTMPPANLLDTDFSRELMPSPRQPEDYTPALHQAYCGNLIDVFGDVVHISESLGRPTRLETDALYSRLVQARASWPKVLCLTPFDQAFADSNEVILNRYNLEFLFLKAVCVLYRNYLGTPGAERERCLAAAEDLVRKQLTMLEHALPGSTFANSTVFLKHYIHDFNLATMILCLDWTSPRPLTTQKDPSGRLSDLRPVISQACDLWLQIGVPSPKARHGLDSILQLLHETKGPHYAYMESDSSIEEGDQGLAGEDQRRVL